MPSFLSISIPMTGIITILYFNAIYSYNNVSKYKSIAQYTNEINAYNRILLLSTLSMTIILGR